MTYRERIRPIRDDEPIHLITAGPRACSSASLILLELGIVLAIIAIVAMAAGVW